MRLLPLLTLSFLLTSPLAAKEVPITPQEALKDFYSELQGQSICRSRRQPPPR